MLLTEVLLCEVHTRVERHAEERTTADCAAAAAACGWLPTGRAAAASSLRATRALVLQSDAHGRARGSFAEPAPPLWGCLLARNIGSRNQGAGPENWVFIAKCFLQKKVLHNMKSDVSVLKPAEIIATEKLGKKTRRYTPGSFGRSQAMPTFSPAKIVLLGETLLTLLWKSAAQTKSICHSRAFRMLSRPRPCGPCPLALPYLSLLAGHLGSGIKSRVSFRVTPLLTGQYLC